MRILELHDLFPVLYTPQRVVVTNHVNPDGDAMGSALGWAMYLEGLGHEVSVVVPNQPPHFLRWLPTHDRVIAADESLDKAQAAMESAEIIFCLDYNALHRAGNLLAPMIEGAGARKVLVDHHREPEEWPNDRYSDTGKGSTAEMVYDLIEMNNGLSAMTAEMATCLYVGIVTDSGSFRFPSTTAQTHRAAAVLLESGAVPAEIHEKIYDVNTRARLQLLGVMLDEMEIIESRNICILHLSGPTMQRHGYTKGDSEGFVNYGLSMSGMRMSAFFREDGDVTKCSFRSKGDLDVNTFARKYFNGGGHLNAAGGLFEGSAKAAIDHLKNAVEKENI